MIKVVYFYTRMPVNDIPDVFFCLKKINWMTVDSNVSSSLIRRSGRSLQVKLLEEKLVAPWEVSVSIKQNV